MANVFQKPVFMDETSTILLPINLIDLVVTLLNYFDNHPKYFNKWKQHLTCLCTLFNLDKKNMKILIDMKSHKLYNLIPEDMEMTWDEIINYLHDEILVSIQQLSGLTSRS
ncbi:hypothetical protein V1478_016255 [Vespula squamosa]|uniref:Uncharacterized protein n=1 Tax=Vespula squamosa TaxID=30214 RepID=A0ABD1ZZB2_VESSQ